MIESAKSSIDISTFKAEVTSKPRGKKLMRFFEALVERKAAGLRVRFLLSWNELRRMVPSANKSAISYLKKHNIDVKILPHNRCCHAKIILVDYQKAIIGSHNLSVCSVSKNFEVSCFISDRQSVADLQWVYNNAFQGAFTL